MISPVLKYKKHNPFNPVLFYGIISKNKNNNEEV